MLKKDDSSEYKSTAQEWREFEEAWRDFVLKCAYALKIDLVVDFLANVIRWVTPK